MWWLGQLSIDPPVSSLAPVLVHLESVKAAWPVAGKENQTRAPRRGGLAPGAGNRTTLPGQARLCHLSRLRRSRAGWNAQKDPEAKRSSKLSSMWPGP